MASRRAAARDVQLPDHPEVVDVAIEVADDLQRHGIGTELAIRTLDRARANGYTHVTATTLQGNAPARALLPLLLFVHAQAGDARSSSDLN